MHSTLVTSAPEEPMEEYLQLQADMRIKFERNPLQVTNDGQGEMAIQIKKLRSLQGNIDELNTSFQCYTNASKPWLRQSAQESITALSDVQNTIDILRKIEESRASVEGLMEIKPFVQNMPEVNAKFQLWKQEWGYLLKTAVKEQNVMMLAKDQAFLRTLHDLLEDLEGVKVKYEEFLQVTRNEAPRLCMLSNEEVTMLLALQGKPDLLKNSHFLSKIFLGVQGLQISKEGEIQGVNSTCGEKFALAKPVDAQDMTLVDIIKELKQALHEAVRQEAIVAVKQLSSSKIAEVIDSLSFQGVLFANQVLYTFEAEQALQNNKLNQLKGKLVDLRAELAASVIKPQSKRNRVTYESLIVNVVHERDMIAQLAHEGTPEGIETMGWQLQTRLYQEKNGDAQLRVGKAIVPCDFEYMGPETRLAITPLSERLHLTVATALSQNMIGSIQGLAGVGKVGMLNDMAVIARRHFMQLACSDQMDANFLAKMLRGACAEGSWLKFNEFNRIAIETLRFFGMYMEEVREALILNQHEMKLLGVPFKINPTFGCFATYNPGYAGRTELPRSLRSISRVMTIIKPNLEIIAKVQLYSSGFENASDLAKKLVCTLQTFQETISRQHQYDFGMRAFKTITKAAGKLKQLHPSAEEEVLLIKALNHLFFRMVPSDVAIGEKIMKAYFPSFDPALMRDNSELETRVIEVFKKMGLVPSKNQVTTTCGLLENIQIRHSGMCLGGPLSGKSTAIQVAAKVVDNVDIVRINTKESSCSEFYGYYNEDREWTDGVFTKQLRKLIEANDGKHKWIVLDGPIDALFVENLNALMDDCRVLNLGNGENVPFKENFNLIFETDSLDVVSPATIARNTFIYFSELNLEWKALYARFRSKFSGKDSKDLDDARQSLEDVFEFLRGTKLVVNLNENQLMQSFLRLLEAQLKEGTSMAKSILFAIIWSFGTSITSESRMAFDDVVKGSALADRAELPKEEFVYSLGLTREMATDKWVKWEDLPSVQSMELMGNSETLGQLNLMSLYAANSIPFLMVGPTATGKTASAEALLAKLGSSQHTAKYTCKKDTTKDEIQELLKKTQDKKSLIFLDNFNLVKKELYGAIPSLEVLRKFLEYRCSEDANIMGALNPSGKGRWTLSPRVFSYFNVISFSSYSECSLEKILLPLCSHPKIVNATIELYKEAKLNFTHESWNLGDLKKIVERVGEVQGIERNLARVWTHQAFHILGDRLIALNKEKLSKIISLISEEILGTAISPEQVQKLIWCEMAPKDQIATSTFYSSYGQLRREIINKLNEVNQKRENQLDIVVHEDNIRHLISLVRAIRHQRGNALLLTSQVNDAMALASLAFQITGVREVDSVSNFNTTLRQALKLAGKEQLETGLVITPEMAKDQEILQEINTFLSTGLDEERSGERLHLVVIVNTTEGNDYLTYPGLVETTFVDLYEGLSNESLKQIGSEVLGELNLDFDSEEDLINASLQILRAAQLANQDEKKDDSEAKFIELLRFFKSDFQGKEAQLNGVLKTLKSIASGVESLSYKEAAGILEKETGEPAKKGDMIVTQLMVKDLSELKVLKKPPHQVKRVLEAVFILLGQNGVTWKDFLSAAKKPLDFLQRLAKINPRSITSDMLENLQAITSDSEFNKDIILSKSFVAGNLCEWVLKMEKRAIEAGVKSSKPKKALEFSPYEKIMPQEEEVKEKKLSQFERDEIESELEVKTKECKQAEEDLRAAEPIWNEAHNATQVLKMSTLNELRMFKNPPEVMKSVLQILCILLQVLPDRKLAKDGKTHYSDYWAPSVKLLASKTKIISLNALELKEKNVEEAEKIFNKPELALEKIKAVSLQAYNLAKWIKAMVNLYRVNQIIVPKRELFKQKRAEVKELKKLLGDQEAEEEEYKTPLEELEAATTPEPISQPPTRVEESGYLDNTLSSGMATIEKRISDVEEQIRRLSLESLRRAALNVFGANLKDQVEKITNVTEKAKPACDSQDLSSKIFEVLLHQEKPQLQQRMKLIYFELDDLRKLQIKQENRLKSVGSTVGGLNQSQIIYDLNSVQEIYSRIKALEIQRGQVMEAVNEMRPRFDSLIKQVERIFESIEKVSTLDKLYVFTLSNFIKLFTQTVIASARVPQTEDRLSFIEESFLKKVHTWVTRGLREADRFLFSLMLGVSLSGKSLESKESEFLFYTQSNSVTQESPLNWLSDEAWTQICKLSSLPSFKGLSQSFKDNEKAWLKIFDKDEPHEYKLPGVWRQRLDEFQFLLVLRAVQPGKLGAAIHDYISNLLGHQFKEDLDFSLKDLYTDSDEHTPVLIITVRDMGPDIRALAQSLGKKYAYIEMGSKESLNFEQTIEEASKSGKWVILNKTDLAFNIQEEMRRSLQFLAKPHRNFKLWVTSGQNELLPRQLIEQSLKVFTQKSSSMKQTLQELLQIPLFQNPAIYDEAPEITRRLYTSAIFNHAGLIQRKKYQIDTSKVYYKFRTNNLMSAISMIEGLAEKASLSFMNYMVYGVIYGGQIGDDNDRRLLQSLAQDALKEITKEGQLTIFGKFTPPTTTLQALKRYVAGMPDKNCVSLFGFSSSEEQIYQEKKSVELLRKCAQLLHPKQSTLNEGTEVAAKLVTLLPGEIKAGACADQSLSFFHQVLSQEAQQYNKFFSYTGNILRKIVSFKKEALPFDHECIQTLSALANGRIPQLWFRWCVPTELGLFDFFQFMREGAQFFSKWSEEGLPKVFTLPYFFFPQRILQAVVQSYAIHSQTSASRVRLAYKLEQEPQESARPLQHSDYEIVDKEGSVRINGLYLARARWDNLEGRFIETGANEPSSKLPTLEVIPTMDKKEEKAYDCPVYRTSLQGSSITGRPQNFIGHVPLPSEEDPTSWVKKGVAMFLRPVN